MNTSTHIADFKGIKNNFDACIYVQCNDIVIDWLIAWYNSLKLSGFNLPIVLIPWDDNLTEVRKRFIISGKATLFDREKHSSLFSWAEDVARIIQPNNPAKWPLFHRLIPLVGPYRNYIFSDADIVFFNNPQDFLDCPDSAVNPTPGRHGQEFVFKYISRSVGYVYNIENRERWPTNTHEFNAGFFVFRNDCFERSLVLETAIEAANSGVLLSSMAEQPFLNYLIDRAGVRKVPLIEEFPSMALSVWPNPIRKGKLERKAFNYYRWDERCEPGNAGKQVRLLHWAGFNLSPWMPFRKVWSYYRFLEENILTEWFYWFHKYLKEGYWHYRNRTQESIGAFLGLARRKYGRGS